MTLLESQGGALLTSAPAPDRERAPVVSTAGSISADAVIQSVAECYAGELGAQTTGMCQRIRAAFDLREKGSNLDSRALSEADLQMVLEFKVFEDLARACGFHTSRLAIILVAASVEYLLVGFPRHCFLIRH